MLKEEKINWVKRYNDSQERIRKMQEETNNDKTSHKIKKAAQ